MAVLPSAWRPLRYHEEQRGCLLTKRKYVVAVAGRGSGKTEIARRKTALSLSIKKEWDNPIYVYALPTYAQAKKVAWVEFQNLIPPRWIPKNGMNISDLSIHTIFGSTLYVVGMDKPQRIEGLQIDGIVIDESSDQKPGIMKSISPMLTHRKAWCWRIGVPKRNGVGRIEFRDFYERGIMGDPNIHSAMWKSSTVLTKEELEEHRSAMSEQDFNEQFNAVWLEAGGSVYYAYDEENSASDIHYNADLPIYVGADFNVDPMSWVLGHFVDGKLYIFDEIFLRDTNTRDTLTHVFNKYGLHRSGWKFCCDASSRARTTKTALTDYIIIKNDERFLNRNVYFPEKNPPLRDRHATVNSLLCNAKGERNVLINDKCKHLINDFKLMAYKEGTSDVEDYTGTDIGHMSDGLGYLAMRVAPMRIGKEEVPVILST